MGGQLHRRMRAPSERADGRADGWTSGRGRACWADKWTSGRGQIDAQTGGRADGGRWTDDGFPKVKLLI